MIETDIACEECNATFTLKFDLNTSRYTIRCCPFCSGENIELEDYDEDENWD